MTTKHTPWKVGPAPTREIDGRLFWPIFDVTEETIAYVKSCSQKDFKSEWPDLLATAPETAAERDRLRAALQTMVDDDGDCYCADNVAAKGPCGYCVAKEVLANTSPAPVESTDTEYHVMRNERGVTLWLDADETTWTTHFHNSAAFTSADLAHDIGTRETTEEQTFYILAKAEKAGG